MSHSVDLHVGNRVRERRLAVGIGLKDLASRVGVSYQQLQKYEIAENRISASRLWRIACVLEVGPGYFFEGLEKGEAEPTAWSGNPALQRAVLALNRGRAGMSDQGMVGRRDVDRVEADTGIVARRTRGSAKAISPIK